MNDQSMYNLNRTKMVMAINQIILFILKLEIKHKNVCTQIQKQNIRLNDDIILYLLFAIEETMWMEI